jgi:hypothetical protein
MIVFDEMEQSLETFNSFAAQKRPAAEVPDGAMPPGLF